MCFLYKFQKITHMTLLKAYPCAVIFHLCTMTTAWSEGWILSCPVIFKNWTSEINYRIFQPPKSISITIWPIIYKKKSSLLTLPMNRSFFVFSNNWEKWVNAIFFLVSVDVISLPRESDVINQKRILLRFCMIPWA